MRALAGRAAAKDYVDAIELHATTLSLGALAWAAAGKDPGFIPRSLLEFATRFARYQPSDLAELQLARPLNLTVLKSRWIEAIEHGRSLTDRLPAEEAGCLYLDAAGRVVEPDPIAPGFAKLARHYG